MEQIPTAELVSEAMRRLALQRAIVPHACAECGAPFEGIARQIYCSKRCKNRVMSRRDRARRRHPPPAGGSDASG